MALGQCTRCDRWFGNDRMFDRHLVIERGPGVHKVVDCLDPATITTRKGDPVMVERVDRSGKAVWRERPRKGMPAHWKGRKTSGAPGREREGTS